MKYEEFIKKAEETVKLRDNIILSSVLVTEEQVQQLINDSNQLLSEKVDEVPLVESGLFHATEVALELNISLLTEKLEEIRRNRQAE